MVKAKWDINGKGAAPAEGGFTTYDGPDLPKGSWPAKLKRVVVTKIKSKGANQGKPRLQILFEVQTKQLEDKSKHKYHGAPVWDGLNIIEGSEGFVNAFLHALTDGSKAQKNAIESAFWDSDKGPDIKRVKVEKGPREGQIDTHIIKIGRVKVNSPNGEFWVQITTKAGKDQNGAYRPEISGYVPFQGKQPGAGGDDDDYADDDDYSDDDDDYGDEDADDDDGDDGIMSDSDVGDDDDSDDEDDGDDGDVDGDVDGEDESGEDEQEAEKPAAKSRTRARKPF